MENYPSNSHKHQREEQLKQQSAPIVEEKRVQKVVSGPVKTKKKSEIRKFADVFIAEDVSKVKKYVFEEVLIPSAKKLFSEMVTNTVDMLLYGETGRSKSNSTPGSRVSYGSYYNDKKYDRRPTYSTYSYDDVVIPDRAEAEAVVREMRNTLARYGLVRVSDLYDFVGITGSYTDNNYGWMNLDDISIIRVRDGYMLKLPKATPID